MKRYIKFLLYPSSSSSVTFFSFQTFNSKSKDGQKIGGDYLLRLLTRCLLSGEFGDLNEAQSSLIKARMKQLDSLDLNLTPKEIMDAEKNIDDFEKGVTPQ